MSEGGISWCELIQQNSRRLQLSSSMRKHWWILPDIYEVLHAKKVRQENNEKQTHWADIFRHHLCVIFALL